MTSRIFCAVAVLALMVTASGALAQATAPAGENLMTPVPKGFKMGAHSSQGRFSQVEYIPQNETVDDWSVMITVSIITGQIPQTPDQFSQGIANGFQQACAHGEGHKLWDGTVNGYAYTEWTASCDLNPATNKPEFLVMRTAQATDSFYNVQYAFRAQPTDERIKQAKDYLETTSICDSRIAARACKVP